MDLFSGLPSLLRELLASTLIVLELMTGAAASLLTSFTLRESPQAETRMIVSLPSSTSSIATSSASAPASTTPKAVVKAPAEVKALPVTRPVQTAVQAPAANSETVNIETRKAIVNILCSVRSAGSLRSISGSGVMIDSRGIILTNAHIAQYFLLRDYPSKDSVDCVIRAGSPAEPLYRATLMYLPPEWIDVNASQITAEHAMGTGEYDYAFLRVVSTTDPSGTLPSSFSNIAMNTSSLDTGVPVLVAGYPAGFLNGQTIDKSLYATSAFTTIGQLYTFGPATNIDVVSLGGTVVAQGGSSGGAVVRMHDGALSGLIVTATPGETTSSRDLRALTLSYINRSLTEAGKGGIAGFLSGNPAQIAEDFNTNVAPKERQTLINALQN